MIKKSLLSLFFVLSIQTNGLCTTLNIIGWETGGNSETDTVSGTVSVQTTVKNSGAYALQANPTTTAVGFHRIKRPNSTTGTSGGFSVNTLYTRFYFRYATKPASGDEEFCSFFQDSTTYKSSLRLNSSGNIVFYDSTATAIATGSTALAQDTWYRIGAQTGTGAAGAFEIFIDGVSEISGTASQTTTGHGRVQFGKTTDRNSNTVDFFYDDVLISDSAVSGAGSVLNMKPDANGSTQQWTAGTNLSDFNEVDDIPPTAATYVASTGSAGDVALFDLQSTGTVGISGTINAVKGWALPREDISVTSSNSLRIRSNVTNNDTTGFNHFTSTTFIARVLDTDPDTSVAWTTGGLDALEVGSVEANAVVMRLQDCGVMVDFTVASRRRQGNLVS